MASSRPIVVQLPRPYRDEFELKQYATKMKEIRLKGLASDPGSFSSSLAMEIDQPMDFWTTRLTHPEARHFVVCLPHKDMSLAEGNHEALKSTWIATLVLLGPRTIDFNTFIDSLAWKHFSDGSPKPPKLPLEGSHLMYYISAVYVDSDFRRQGLGRNLSIETIKAIKMEVQKERAAGAVIMIGAEQNNTSAIKLYKSLGWKEVVVEKFTAKDGRDLVGIQLCLEINLKNERSALSI